MDDKQMQKEIDTFGGKNVLVEIGALKVDWKMEITTYFDAPPPWPDWNVKSHHDANRDVKNGNTVIYVGKLTPKVPCYFGRSLWQIW